MKKRLKPVLFILGSLVLLSLLVVWMLPPEGRVVRSITIYAPRTLVFSKLTHLKTYPKWFPWIQPGSDTAMGIIYYGKAHENLKGFAFENPGKEAGYGHLELGETEGDSVVTYYFDFKKMPRIYGSYTLHENDSKTVLVWEVEMKAGWKPWWRFFASMMNKMTSPVMDTGLKKLKALCES